MCYSAMVAHDYLRYVREFGAELSLQDFYDLFYRRLDDPRIRLPKAMEAGIAAVCAVRGDPVGLLPLIERFKTAEATRLEQALFKQRRRLADAERALQVRETQTALEHRRIASSKISWTLDKLADLRRGETLAQDARIFPGHHAPVLVWQDGRRVIKPMRYQCRLPGKPASIDSRYPGTYNARRDNLQGFWKPLFGHRHGLVLMQAFYENVAQHRLDGRELEAGERARHVVLEFRPRPAQDMWVACLWSHWQGPGEADLLSFAAITDEPPPEVAAAGHDRCIIPIRPERIDAWLTPDPRRLDLQQALLDDRQQPFYEHRLAA